MEPQTEDIPSGERNSRIEETGSDEPVCKVGEACADIKPTVIINENPMDHVIRQRVRVLQNIYSEKDYMTKEKKWLLALFIALFVILICSSFTVGALDGFLHSMGIELFTEGGNKNEVILNVCQFLLILIGVRFVLQYY